MEATKPTYLTATSLTARQINRRIILNIIYKQQPISRADTARETGLQRSTVSLIVDELINDGWVVEGEHVHIPRGRRPIYLQINAEKAGLYGLHIRRNSLHLTVADLNGTTMWTGHEDIADFSPDNFGKALRRLRENAMKTHKFKMKGAGVALEDTTLENDTIQGIVEAELRVPAFLDSIAIACGKWFLLSHKDSKLAGDHLVTVNVDSKITLGAIIAGKPLRGAHDRAGIMLNDDSNVAKSNGKRALPADQIEDIGKRLEFAVAAYDPGVILITGPMAASIHNAEAVLQKHIRAAGASDTVIKVLAPGDKDVTTYLDGAVAVILSHFLDECPT